MIERGSYYYNSATAGLCLDVQGDRALLWTPDGCEWVPCEGLREAQCKSSS